MMKDREKSFDEHMDKMSRELEKRKEESLTSQKLEEGLFRLKRGFQCSLVAAILLVASMIFHFFGFRHPFFWLVSFWVLIFCAGFYVLSIYVRFRGWMSLNQHRISISMILGGLIVLLSPFTYYTIERVFLPWQWLPWEWQPYLSFILLQLIGPLAWVIYVIFESYGFRALKRSYNINLSNSMILNLLGVFASMLGVSAIFLFEFYQYFYFEFYHFYILSSFLFSYPFLVASFFSCPFIITSRIFSIVEMNKAINEKKELLLMHQKG